MVKEARAYYYQKPSGTAGRDALDGGQGHRVTLGDFRNLRVPVDSVDSAASLALIVAEGRWP